MAQGKVQGVGEIKAGLMPFDCLAGQDEVKGIFEVLWKLGKSFILK